MNKEVISDKQGIIIIIMHMIGTSSIFMTALAAKKDLWLAILIALFMALIMSFILARIKTIFLKEDLFQILDICFGKFIGKIISILFTLYLFHTGILILMNITQFIKITALFETPEIIIRIVLSIVCIWIVKEGIEVIGRFSQSFFIPVISFILVFVLLSVAKMNTDNIMPILSEGIKPIANGVFYVFSFPLGELGIYTIIFYRLKQRSSFYRVYMLGVLIGGIILLTISLTNLLVLGINTATSVYYQTHLAASIIDIGGFLQRIEAVIVIVFILAAFIKNSIYLLAACKGTAKIFGNSDYRFIVTPIALLMLNLSYFMFDSLMSYMEWDKDVWPYYAFPFQVILPIVIWIVAEIKNKQIKRKKTV